MTKKLQSCTECSQLHTPKGGRKCTYVELAKITAQAATGKEEDWKHYLDLDTIAEDNSKYLGEESPSKTDYSDAGMVQLLVQECRDGRKLMEQQMAMLTGLMQGIAGLGEQGVMASGGASATGGGGAGAELLKQSMVQSQGIVTEEEGKQEEEAPGDTSMYSMLGNLLGSKLAGSGGTGAGTGLTQPGSFVLGKKYPPMYVHPPTQAHMYAPTSVPSPLVQQQQQQQHIQQVGQLQHQQLHQQQQQQQQPTPGESMQAQLLRQIQGFLQSGGVPGSQQPSTFVLTDSSKKRRYITFDLEPHMAFDRIKSPTIHDVISASMGLEASIGATGVNTYNYGRHIKFLLDKVRVYDHVALMRYDMAMRDRGELAGLDSFCYGDHELWMAHIGPEGLSKFKSGEDWYSGNGDNQGQGRNRGRGRGRGWNRGGYGQGGYNQGRPNQGGQGYDQGYGGQGRGGYQGQGGYFGRRVCDMFNSTSVT